MLNENFIPPLVFKLKASKISDLQHWRELPNIKFNVTKHIFHS